MTVKHFGLIMIEVTRKREKINASKSSQWNYVPVQKNPLFSIHQNKMTTKTVKYAPASFCVQFDHHDRLAAVKIKKIWLQRIAWKNLIEVY